MLGIFTQISKIISLVASEREKKIEIFKTLISKKIVPISKPRERLITLISKKKT